MREFDLDIAVNVKLIAPQEFTQQFREQAKSVDATDFLKQAQADFPEDDDAFTLAIIQNGISVFTRRSLAVFFAQAGLGYKFPKIEGDAEQTNLEKVPVDLSDIPSHGEAGSLEQGDNAL